MVCEIATEGQDIQKNDYAVARDKCEIEGKSQTVTT